MIREKLEIIAGGVAVGVAFGLLLGYLGGYLTLKSSLLKGLYIGNGDGRCMLICLTKEQIAHLQTGNLVFEIKGHP